MHSPFLSDYQLHSKPSKYHYLLQFNLSQFFRFCRNYIPFLSVPTFMFAGMKN